MYTSSFQLSVSNSMMGQKGINDICLWIAEGTAASQVLDCHQSYCHAEHGSWASLSAVHRAEGPEQVLENGTEVTTAVQVELDERCH